MKKRIFLTGASSGIGRTTAELLAASGHEVWGTSRDPNRVPIGTGIHAVRLDLSDAGSIEESFQSATREAGGFDVVINNAGSGHFGPAELMTRELITGNSSCWFSGRSNSAGLRLPPCAAGTAASSSTSLRWLRVCRFHSWQHTTRRKQPWLRSR